MTAPIDIRPHDLDTVRSILRAVLLTEAKVWVFGSRATWTTKDSSDLDLAIDVGRPLTRDEESALRNAFEDSDLPYTVDVVDMQTVSETFGKIVERDKVALQTDERRSLKLEELGKIITGKTPPTADPNNFGITIPFVTPTDMDGHRIIDKTSRHLSHSGASCVDAARIPACSVMVSCIGSDMGKSAIAGKECVTNQQINSIIVNEICDYMFIYYNLSARKDEIRGMASGSAQPILYKSAFGRLLIDVPPLSEQRHIAAILSGLDDKIELNRRMNETLETMAQALFKDWFIDFGPTRAKAEGRAPYLAPELWSLFPATTDGIGKPEGWENEALYEQATWINGAAYKDMHFSDAQDALPVVKIAELKAGINASTKRTNTNLGDNYKIGDGDLLFSWSGNPDTSIDAFLWLGGKAWLNQHIFVVRPNGKQSKAMLFSMLKCYMPEFAEIARNKQTTGLGHVTKADMQRIAVCLGSAKVRSAFEEIVGPLIERIITNLLEIKSLAVTRDYLLPKLMSGEIRIREAEKLVAAAV